VLPVIASMTMLATIELGADTGQSMQQQEGNMKLFMRGLAVSLLPSSRVFSSVYVHTVCRSVHMYIYVRECVCVNVCIIYIYAYVQIL